MTRAAQPYALTKPPPGPLRMERQSTLPLFSPYLTRRANLSLLLSVEGGGELHHPEGGLVSGFAGFRLANVLEFGGGVRMLKHCGTKTEDAQDLRTSWLGFFRLLLHFDADAHRRVGLPIGVDIGAGDARIFTRIILGLRVRVVNQLSVGLYPFNPTYTQFADNDLKQKAGWWSFPTTAELIFAF